MARDLYLGLDVGTRSTKALLVDPDRGIVKRAASEYDLIPDRPPGAAEQHPDTWIQAVREVAWDVLRGVDSKHVRGVGVAGQQHGFVALDARRKVIRPAKLWCDTSTSEQADELSRTFGKPVPTGFTASKILWLKQREPESFQKLRYVLLPHDYINYRLTGQLTTEPGDASGTGLFDVARRQFDRGRVDAIDPGLIEMLPELRMPGEFAGALHTDGANLLGLEEGVPVSTGGGDNMMSAIGSGAIAEGVVVLSLGTSGTVFTHVDRPTFDPDGLIAPFCGSAGGWLPLLCVMNLTGVTEEVCTAFAMNHAEMTELAWDINPGCGGLLWLPFLSGERVPDLPESTGSLLGIRPGTLQPGALYRAAMEGTSLNLAWGIARLRAMDIAIEELRLVGGAANNRLWCEILADVCEVPVRRLLESESAALGAALQAMWAVARQDDPDLEIKTVVEPFVRVSDEVLDPGPAVSEYRAMREEYAVALDRYYGVV